MTNIVSLVILGIYTLIYVIVFFIQKTQIDANKGVIDSMKSFIDIFKIDEVKKYVELKNDRVMMDAEKLLWDNDKVKGIVSDSIDETVDHLKDTYFKQLTEQNQEMFSILVDVLYSMPAEHREPFIKARLQINQEIYLAMIQEMPENKPQNEKLSDKETE